MMESVFTRLPESFFIPLASPNRHHYAALLLVYYRLFAEYRSSAERELVVSRFAEYFAGPDASDRIVDEEEEGGGAAAAADRTASTAGPEPRVLAGLFLRKLIGYGWMAEEEQLDFSRVITSASMHALHFEKPVFERNIGMCGKHRWFSLSWSDQFPLERNTQVGLSTAFTLESPFDAVFAPPHMQKHSVRKTTGSESRQLAEAYT